MKRGLPLEVIVLALAPIAPLAAGSCHKEAEQPPPVVRVYEAGKTQETIAEQVSDEEPLRHQWYKKERMLRLVGGKFVSDRPYDPYGSFGGDGEHFLDDRGEGIYYSVHGTVHDSSGAVIGDYGELFLNPSRAEVYNGPCIGDRSVLVERIDGRFRPAEDLWEDEQQTWRKLQEMLSASCQESGR